LSIFNYLAPGLHETDGRTIRAGRDDLGRDR